MACAGGPNACLMSATCCVQGRDTVEIFIPFSDPRVAENTWRPFLCLDTETDFNTKCIRMSSGIECTQTCMRSWLFISSKCPCSPISATGELVCCPSNLLA
jgi:hypothetical protein